MGAVRAQGRPWSVHRELWQVLRRQGEGQGSPDLSGRQVLCHLCQAHPCLQQGQASGHPVLCEARAEHRLRRWICQALRLWYGPEGHAWRVSLQYYVWS